jgi:hypothetical protein
MKTKSELTEILLIELLHHRFKTHSESVVKIAGSEQEFVNTRVFAGFLPTAVGPTHATAPCPPAL